jgi:hypothetical protein
MADRRGKSGQRSVCLRPHSFAWGAPVAGYYGSVRLQLPWQVAGLRVVVPLQSPSCSQPDP